VGDEALTHPYNRCNNCVHLIYNLIVGHSQLNPRAEGLTPRSALPEERGLSPLLPRRRGVGDEALTHPYNRCNYCVHLIYNLIVGHSQLNPCVAGLTPKSALPEERGLSPLLPPEKGGGG
jgi:PP-loop superfamily ATP-utilizing enzyme